MLAGRNAANSNLGSLAFAASALISLVRYPLNRLNIPDNLSAVHKEEA